MKRAVGLFTVFLALFFLHPSANATGPRIENGSSVRLNYFLEANGEPVVSQEKKAAMEFVVGKGSFPPAFEKQLMGLQKGDTKSFKLGPEQAFGPYRSELVKRIPKDQLPPQLPLKEGMMLGTKSGQHPIRVAKVLEDSVVLDENHPFAGKTLAYHVQVTDVE